MGNPKTIIELNGRAYDALSGKVLADAAPGLAGAKSIPQYANPMRQSGRVMDGFSRRTAHDSSAAANIIEPSKPLVKATIQSPRTVSAKPVQHHAPQKSKTLMRKAVSRPSPDTSESTHAHASQLSPVAALQHPDQHKINTAEGTERMHRAGNHARSAAISKFTPQVVGFTKKTTPLAVQQAPAHVAPHAEQLVTPGPVPLAHQAGIAHEHSSQHRPKARRFGKTIKGLGLAASTLSVLLLAGFFAYQYMPNLAMRVAANRAGFSAHLPGYQPSGFSLQRPIQHSPGQVTLSFQDTSGDRQFALTQRRSTWNSETLLENVVTASNQPYQTYQDKGNTIYIYGDSNATWVSGGVWYQIEGGLALSSDQLLRIANSF